MAANFPMLDWFLMGKPGWDTGYRFIFSFIRFLPDTSLIACSSLLSHKTMVAR